MLVKETGKFMINDLELMQQREALTKQAGKKRMRIEAAKDSDDEGSSVGDNVSEDSSDTDEEEIRQRMKNATKRQKTSASGAYKAP